MWKKLRDDPDIPSWVDNVKLVLVVDMMRSNWEVVHDYDDVTKLAKELKKIGGSKGFDHLYPGGGMAHMIQLTQLIGLMLN